MLCDCLPELSESNRTRGLYSGAPMHQQPHATKRMFGAQGKKTKRAPSVQGPVTAKQARSAGDPYAPHGEGVKGVPTHGRAIVKGRKVRPTSKFRKALEELEHERGGAGAGSSGGGARSSSSSANRCRKRTEKTPIPLWEGGHNEQCEKCSSGGNLVLCSFCNLAFHQRCLSPPLTRVPQGHWACVECTVECADAEAAARATGTAAAACKRAKKQHGGGTVNSDTVLGACPCCTWTAPLKDFVEALLKHRTDVGHTSAGRPATEDDAVTEQERFETFLRSHPVTPMRRPMRGGTAVHTASTGRREVHPVVRR